AGEADHSGPLEILEGAHRRLVVGSLPGLVNEVDVHVVGREAPKRPFEPRAYLRGFRGQYRLAAGSAREAELRDHRPRVPTTADRFADPSLGFAVSIDGGRVHQIDAQIADRADES